MLNSKALSELLTSNRDSRLCKRWFVMTPNGTLLAYSQPTNISELRRQAAMAATSWQGHDRSPDDDGTDMAAVESSGRNGGIRRPLHALTIETEEGNLLLRTLQPQLLLGLEGGVPRRKTNFESRVTPEGPGDAAYPLQNGSREEGDGAAGGNDSAVASAASSIADSTVSAASRSILALQRKRLDAMAEEIVADFARTGFKMPEDEGARLF